LTRLSKNKNLANFENPAKITVQTENKTKKNYDKRRTR
jgi:hypothetical protein